MTHVKLIGQCHIENLETILSVIAQELIPLFPEIAKLPPHEVKSWNLNGKELITLRDLNDGYTFKGPYLLQHFTGWDKILSYVKSLVGDVLYELPHIVLHKSDIIPHMDRRSFSVNIGLLNSDGYNVLILDRDKTNIREKICYKTGEVIAIDTRQFHAVRNINGEKLRGFIVFTPKNDIRDLLESAPLGR